LGGAGLVSKNRLVWSVPIGPATREAVDFALRHAGLINH
jgi:hypothetical protein